MNPPLPRAYRVNRVLLFSIAIVIAAPFSAQSEPTATPTPCMFTTFSETFDGTTVPLLPQGWIAANAQGAAPLWVSSSTTPASPPNCAFIDDPATVSDKHLDSRDFFYVADAGPLQVSFLNNYALEPVGGGTNFFDGGVLEISVGGGPFTDVTAAGGSFVTGGYNGVISTEFGNPLGGRMAWSQSSSGYINTVVNLGSVQNTFKLRFRMCSDASGSGVGWRIDNLVVSQGCGGGVTPTPTPTPSPIHCASEGFDNISTLVPGGWFMQNNSQPGPGSTGWFQGNTAVFDARNGAPTSYIGTNFNNGTGTSTLSNWLLTPPVALQTGAVLSFWTRTVDIPTFPDRLQVRMSTNGGSANVGSTATSVGDFTTVLLDINPTYTTSGYPNVWTHFAVTLSGIASPTTGRMALRYFVENGGPTGTNSDYIGVDSLSFQSGCPDPTPTPSTTPTPTAAPPTPTKCPGGCSPSPTPTPSPTPSPSPSPTPTPPPASPTPTECPWCFTPTPSPSPTPVTQAINLSTRLRVDAGNNVGIGGLIITGTEPKPVLIRVIGPSLSGQGIPNPLADPMLRLHGPSGFIEVTNDNWRETQEQEIIATGIPPTNDLESAIVITLDPGSYTAIVSGNGGAAGVALLEIYDLNPLTDSKLANLSTRAQVLTGSDIVIAGFLLSDSGMQDHVIVRGIGPSLSSVLPANSLLANPTLELRDSNAALIITNDDWQDDPAQAGEINAAGLAPANALEAAASVNLSPGLYTALLSGTNSGTGIGVVEIYDLGP